MSQGGGRRDSFLKTNKEIGAYQMKPEKDAYGQEIWAYLNGEKYQEIVERDDGFVDISGGPAIYFAEYRSWSENDKKAIKLVKGKVLDIGCGAGRNSLYLQKKGYDVTGIDNSPLAIKTCKKRGLKKARVMSIDQVHKFKPNSFDTIIMFGNNFGLFGSFKKSKILLKKLYKITSQKAQIIAESLNPHGAKVKEHLDYQRLNKKRGRMTGQIRIRIRFKNSIGNCFDYLLVSKEEMTKILKGTGWKVKKFINSKSSKYTAIIVKEDSRNIGTRKE